MSPTITRNALSGPRPGGLPVARAIAPYLAEAHEDPLEAPESEEPESRLDQVLADLDLAPSFKPPSIKRPDLPPPIHFNPNRALSAKPAPKPVTRRKAEPPPSVEGALMTAEEVCAILRISEKAMEHLRRRGTGPKHVSIGGNGRSVRYRREDVDAYLAGLADQGGR